MSECVLFVVASDVVWWWACGSACVRVHVRVHVSLLFILMLVSFIFLSSSFRFLFSFVALYRTPLYTFSVSHQSLFYSVGLKLYVWAVSVFCHWIQNGKHLAVVKLGRGMKMSNNAKSSITANAIHTYINVYAFLPNAFHDHTRQWVKICIQILLLPNRKLFLIFVLFFTLYFRIIFSVYCCRYCCYWILSLLLLYKVYVAAACGGGGGAAAAAALKPISRNEDRCMMYEHFFFFSFFPLSFLTLFTLYRAA